MQFSSFDDAWLGLGDTSKIQVDNEFLTNVKFETLGLDALRILRNPSNFSLTAKVFFNVDVLPMQAAILQELWSRPFPMYIASRGFGKAIFPDELVRVKNGWKKIKDIEVGDYVYGGDGRLARVSATTGIMHNLRMYDVYFEDGRKISCCKDHLWKVFDKHASKWVVMDTLQIYDGFQKERYAIPINKPISDDDESIDEKEKRLYTQLDKCSTTLDGIYIVKDRVAANEVIDLARSVGLYVDVIYTDVGTIMQMYNKDIVNISNIKCCGLSDGCCIEVENDDHTYITKDYIVTHNSYLLGLYAMLRLLLIPGHKIVIVGAGFRQAKVIFEYMETIWHGADVLRSVCDAHSGPRRDIDRCTMYINDSVATCVPLGDGQKIRGLRAHTIISDEFNCSRYNTLVETDIGLVRIQDLMNREDFHVVNNGGEYEKPHNNIITKPCDVYEIKTMYGYTIGCSANHIVMTQNGWKRVLELDSNDYIICDNKYTFPSKTICASSEYISVELDEEMAHTMGWVVRDKRILGYEPDAVVLWKLEALGLDVDNHNKCVPWSILQSSADIIKSFLNGVFKGNFDYFYNTSEVLVQDLQTLLLKLNMIYERKFDGKYWSLRFVRDLNVDDDKEMHLYVESVTKLSDQEVLYDFYLPQTHSFYGNGFVQHNSIPTDIYESVVIGFASVSADPISNVKEAARRKEMRKHGLWSETAEERYQDKAGNQAIISGTAGYGFQPFATYWKRYMSIIKSRGDESKLKEIFGDEGPPENFSWKDYSIIRIPYEIVPEGFMDDKQVSRAKATIHSAIYASEYGACFVEDSDGFFKRSLIESCVATTRNIGQPGWPKWCPKEFDARVVGGNGLRYIYGVDPASEVDNFSIVILELHPEHTRIVYTWSINRKLFKQRVSAGMATENDFYAFCARKIRDLMTIFPCDAIAMDAQGGGVAVEEALHDTDKLQPGEIPIWPVIEADKEKDTDIQAGLHILHLCQFAKGDWTAAANHGLRKDLEDKVLLFPRFDPVTIELSIEEDKRRQTAFQKANPDKIFNIYDTLEDCIMEIEELKNELCTIVMTRTGTGVGARDRWDTPEIKLTGGKKGRMRKDRYSALVMANMISRSIQRATPPLEYGVIGGAVGTIDGEQGGQMYVGPEWFTRGMNDSVIFGVSRR